MKLKESSTFLEGEAERDTYIDIDGINALLAQLSKHPRVLTLEHLLWNVLSGCHMAVRRTEDGKIIAMATLLVCRKPSGPFGLIEDVVVDKDYRGQGIAKEMLGTLFAKAKELKLEYVELTSSPKRVEANQLYTVLGFDRRETNVYRFSFKK